MKKLFFLFSLLMCFSIGQVWGADVTYDFTGSDWTVSNGTLSNGTVSFTGASAGSKGSFKMNSGYFMMGKSGAYLTFPTYAKAVAKIVITGKSGASASTKMNIYVGQTAVSTETTGSTGTNTYEIASASQAAGTVYTLKVTSDHNTQITKIEIYYAEEVPAGTCATPTFSLDEGTYEGTQSVTISCSTTGATIYYTTDGGTPSSSSTEYEGAISVSATQTIKAIAIKDGLTNSEVATATYTITEGPDVTLDFTSNTVWKFPTSNTLDEGTFSDGTYTVKVKGEGSGKGYKFSSGKLLIGQSGAYLLLPEFANPITKIVCPGVSGASGSVKWNVYDGETAVSTEVTGCTSDVTFEIDPKEANKQYKIRLNSAHNLQISHVKIYFGEEPAVAKPIISGLENFVTSTEVGLTCSTEGATIYYTTDGSNPKTSNTKNTYSAAFTLSATTTIKAAAKVNNDWSNVAEKTFTKVTPMTVAQALNVTPAINKCVKGVVATITEISTEHGNATYTIKDEDADNSMIIYRGLYLNNTAFTTEDQIYVGDEVTIFGTISEYQSVNQFAQGNYIVALKPAARLAWSAESFNASLEGANTFPTLTNTNGVSVSYSSSDESAATINSSTGAISLVAVGSTTITASFAGNETYKAKSVSYTLNVASSLVTLTYNVDGGEAIDPVNVSALPNPLPTTTKAGKNFGGWFTDANKTVAAVAGAAITENTTLYAKWLDPYTVAEAKAVIDGLNGGTKDNQYVAGIISQIDSYSSQYHSITYWISADGTTTNQLEVYSGKGLNSANFSAVTDLELGDEVVVTGTLKKYNDVYEFDKNNYLYSLSRKASAGLEYAVTAVNKAVDDDAFINPLTNPNSVAVTYATSDDQVAEVANDGTVTIIGEGSATITASFAGNETYSAAQVSYTLTVSATVDTRKVAESPEGGFSSISGYLSGNEISFAAYQGGASNAPNGSNTANELRLYKYQATTEYGGYVTITAKSGCTIDQVVITVGGNCNVGYCKDEEELPTKEGTPTAVSTSSPFDTGTGLNASSVSVVNLDGSNQFKIKSITVYYTGESAALESIAISGTATVLEYSDGDEFDPTGLVVTGTYSDGSEEEITEGITWAYNPATLSAGTTSVSVTATVGELTSAAFMVNGLIVSEAPVPSSSTYRKVTATADITDGEYLIVYEATSVAFNGALETLDAEGNSIAVTISEGVIAGTTAIDAAVFTIDATAGTLQSASGYYIGVSSNSNGLKQTDNAATYTHTFSIDDDGNAVILANFEGSTMKLRYNPSTSSGNLRFRYYKNDGQQAVQLYKKESTQPVEPEEPVLIFEELRSGLNVNSYYTVCMDKNILAVRGATFWSLNNRAADGSEVYFEEATAPYEAGKPYIFYTSSSTVEVAYGGETAVSPVANGALRGTFDPMDQDAINAASTANGGSDIYIVSSNQLWQVAGRSNNSLGANRAYIVYNDLVSGEPAPVAGRRVIRMPMQGNTATGIDGLSVGTDETKKVILNGQFFIIREGKTYDVTGCVVK